MTDSQTVTPVSPADAIAQAEAEAARIAAKFSAIPEAGVKPQAHPRMAFVWYKVACVDGHSDDPTILRMLTECMREWRKDHRLDLTGETGYQFLSFLIVKAWQDMRARKAAQDKANQTGGKK